MSDFFKKSNSESTLDLYFKSLNYKFEMENPTYGNLKNFYLAEKYMYGRVNRWYVPMEVDSPRAPMGTLNQVNKNNGSGFQVLKFVAQAYNELEQQFRVKTMSGHINASDPYLSALDIQTAYTPPRTLYQNYLSSIKKSFMDYCVSNNVYITNFSLLITYLSDFISKTKREVSFTYPAFIKSTKCPMSATGLVIELATIASDDDDAKIVSFKNSPNWEFYLNACRSYGFSVDANIPWRLVADIGSSEMVNYARNIPQCSYMSTDGILGLAYTPAHKQYFQNFRNILMSFYMAASRPRLERDYAQEYECIVKQSLTQPERYTNELYTQVFDDLAMLELYMNIRLIEETECALTAHQKQRLQGDIRNLALVRSIEDAVDIFESIIGQTYNYSGSLTDLFHRAMIIKEEEINVLSST